jgi:hypothetical protein
MVKDLARPAERNLRLPPFAVNGHDHMTITAIILMMVESAPAFGQPFSECCAFHRYAPVFEPSLVSQYLHPSVYCLIEIVIHKAAASAGFVSSIRRALPAAGAFRYVALNSLNGYCLIDCWAEET